MLFLRKSKASYRSVILVRIKIWNFLVFKFNQSSVFGYVSFANEKILLFLSNCHTKSHTKDLNAVRNNN